MRSNPSTLMSEITNGSSAIADFIEHRPHSRIIKILLMKTDPYGLFIIRRVVYPTSRKISLKIAMPIKPNNAISPIYWPFACVCSETGLPFANSIR